MTSVEPIPMLTMETFDPLIAQDGVAVVEFFAPWCAPCGMTEELLSELARETPEDVRFYRVNADEQSALSDRYGVLSLPTIVLFRRGEERMKTVGPKSRRVLLQMIEEARG